VRGAADVPHIPYSKLKNRVNFTETRNALVHYISKSAGHATFCG